MRDIPEYHIVRSRKRRTAAIRVEPDAVRVTVPYWVDDRWVEDWVASKTPWIRARLEQMQGARQRYGIEVAQGAEIPVAGARLRLSWEDGARSQVHCEAGLLRLTLSRRGRRPETERAKALLEQWLKGRAAEFIPPRLLHWSQVMGLRYSDMQLKGFRRRWGSCDSKGLISINWRLIFVEPELLDYVLIHELAHLRHFHHGPEFWRLVAQFYPTWKQARQTLYQRSSLLDF